MKLYIKQKVSFWDEFFVKDENGTDRYRVDGEIFTFGKRLHVYDMARGNEEIMYLAQKPFAFLPKVDIYDREDGEVLFTVNREFTLFVPSFYAEGLDWHVQGDFGAHNYEITCGDKLVATVEKEWFTWGDSYAIEIYDVSDELYCLGILLAVDIINAAQASS